MRLYIVFKCKDMSKPKNRRAYVVDSLYFDPSDAVIRQLRLHKLGRSRGYLEMLSNYTKFQFASENQDTYQISKIIKGKIALPMERISFKITDKRTKKTTFTGLFE